jgi:hypothetical protein
VSEREREREMRDEREREREREREMEPALQKKLEQSNFLSITFISPFNFFSPVLTVGN